MKKIFSVAVLLISFSLVHAQTVTVYDKISLKPVERVEVFTKNKSFTGITSQSGVLNISALKLSDTLCFRHLSYKSQFIPVSDLKNKNYKIFMDENIVELEATVLSASKLEEKQSDVAQKIQTLKKKEIQLLSPQNSGQLLAESGQVYLQESQLGGGSPVLRGFEANKVLLVMDGVRMNNAIYRGGHLQNIITIDPLALDKVEVVYGPGSVIYGSDALGGVMHFITHTPSFREDGNQLFKVEAMTKWASAANEKLAHLRIQSAGKKWATSTSVTLKDIGDLRSGGKRDPLTGDWGKCLFYVERINGKDSALINNNPLIQKQTGYQQMDINHKTVIKTGQKSKLIANIQFSNSSDIPRYDRLQEWDPKTNNPKYAEWYYGPQTRLLTSLSSVFYDGNWYDHLNLTASWQKIAEDRNTRRFNNNWTRTQEERVDVLSFNADISKQFGKDNELRFGLEFNNNEVESQAFNTNINSDEVKFNAISRYPDGGNTMFSSAAYLTHNWELRDHLIFSQGLRFSTISLESEYTDEMMTLTGFPFDKKISLNHNALTGNLGLSFMPGYGWRLAIFAASGFRSPNVDDIGKVNDSKPGDFLIVPNPDLKPEYAYNLDLTLGKSFSDNLQLEVTGFISQLKDAMVVMPFNLNGQDSIMYNGALTSIQANVNAGKARIYGVQGNFLAQITNNFSIRSSLTYTSGRLTDKDIPLDHIPPMYGVTSFKFSLKRFEGVFYIRYNGWKHIDDYSPSGEDNPSTATSEGTPEWYTLNLKTSVYLSPQLSVQAGIENILDRHYRTFASGVSASGRNVFIAVRASL